MSKLVTRRPLSQSSKIIIQLDATAHELLTKEAFRNDRTIRDQARFYIKQALGLLNIDKQEGR